MTRAQALAAARVAGFHNDSATYTRLCIEERVNRIDMRAAWAEGVRAKSKGVACDCRACQRGSPAVAELQGRLSPAEVALCRS